MRKVLYICYYHVTEPLVQTQVLTYLRELARGGVEVLKGRRIGVGRVAELGEGKSVNLLVLAHNLRPTGKKGCACGRSAFDLDDLDVGCIYPDSALQ